MTQYFRFHSRPIKSIFSWTRHHRLHLVDMIESRAGRKAICVLLRGELSERLFLPLLRGGLGGRLFASFFVERGALASRIEPSTRLPS